MEGGISGAAGDSAGQGYNIAQGYATHYNAVQTLQRAKEGAVTGAAFGAAFEGLSASKGNVKTTFENSKGGRGTVWDRINPTQEYRYGTQIPKSFNINIDGADYWVAPNATKHMYEYITREGTNFEYNFSTPINSQSILTEFDAALQDAIRNNGVTIDKMIKGGDWEFILSAPREEGLNYVVKHARYNPN